MTVRITLNGIDFDRGDAGWHSAVHNSYSGRSAQLSVKSRTKCQIKVNQMQLTMLLKFSKNCFYYLQTRFNSYSSTHSVHFTLIQKFLN